MTTEQAHAWIAAHRDEFFPTSWRSDVSFATHDYDGTYGASTGSQSLTECQQCLAWVDSRRKDEHLWWHFHAAPVMPTYVAPPPAPPISAPEDVAVGPAWF